MQSLLDQYNVIRNQTVALSEGLSAEDLCPQSMPDASPGKWHLAHTTWFFETFILQAHSSSFQWFREEYNFLFNSYYDSVGKRHARPQRGLLTRPTLQKVFEYRDAVDEGMRKLLNKAPEEISPLVVIGLHHEMQHQELFLTDLLHLLSMNPMRPAVLERNTVRLPVSTKKTPAPLVSFDSGLMSVGAVTENGLWDEFSYDCEQPRHQIFQTAFKLAPSLVTNQEWMAFIDDGGYENSLLWLSDGWAEKNRQSWQAPLYWEKRDGVWWQFGLDGLQMVDPNAPVCHVSYFEAEAFARWAGKRLPREHELEYVAASKPVAGNFLESYSWRPFAANSNGDDFEDIYGDVWEWTQSPFTPYPGFDPKQGALGEYNGKFMANQFVLKGGSCATPRQQIRPSYRNFFYPHQRWQFTGLRLAED